MHHLEKDHDANPDSGDQLTDVSIAQKREAHAGTVADGVTICGAFVIIRPGFSERFLRKFRTSLEERGL